MKRHRDGVARIRSQLTWLAGQPAFRKRPLLTLVRLGRWRVKTWRGSTGRVWLDQADAYMLLPSEWRGMAKLTFAFRELAEPELPIVASLVPTGTIAIDGGAHYGDYTLMLSRAVGGQGQVWAIEPCAEFMRACRQSVEFNGLKNVRFFHAGLAETTRLAQLIRDEDPSRSYVSDDESADQGTVVQLRTLDDICAMANGNRRPVSLIKLDIEGFELSALKGAQQTIRSWRPLLLIEFQEETCRRLGNSTQDLWEFIEGMNYSMFLYSWRNEAWVPCTQLDGRQANYLCVPNEEVLLRIGRI